MNSEQAREIAEVCKMLADGTRVQMVVELAKGQKSVSAISEALGINQPTASHHLALLRMSGLLNRERQGKQMFYRVNKKRLQTVIKLLDSIS